MMITTRKSLKVSILGKSYALATDESSELVYQAAAMLDGLMQSKAAGVAAGSLDKVALITALQLATDLIKTQQSLKEYESKCKAMLALTEK